MPNDEITADPSSAIVAENYFDQAPVTDQSAWLVRPWLLAGIGFLAGMVIYVIVGITDDPFSQSKEGEIPWRASAFALIFFASLAFGFSLERFRWRWALAFSLIAGLVMAGVFWWNSGLGQNNILGYSLFSGLFALAIATPIFQSFRDSEPLLKPWQLPYQRLHFHAWTDAVIGASSLVFLGGSWLMMWLIAALFLLIDVNLVKEIISHNLFICFFSGAILGASLGLLRENEKIIGALQHIVQLILSILAPLLAGALALFLISLIFTGIDNLWQTTKSTTPIMLACAAGALLLANAVIRDDRSGASDSRILRSSAMVLSLTILPLTLIAAVSMGARIGQYGLSPERLWAMVTIAIGCSYGLAYLYALIRGRMDWDQYARPVNSILALAVCVIALLLALPIMDFGAISARDQIARLEAGKVSPQQFDYRALRFEFGPAGVAALYRLAQSDDIEIASRAKEAVAGGNVRILQGSQDQLEIDKERYAQAQKNLKIYPRSREVPQELLAYIVEKSQCVYFNSPCLLWFFADDHVMLQPLVSHGIENIDASHFLRLIDGKWQYQQRNDPPSLTRKEVEAIDADSIVEVREVTRRQLFINGKPIAEPFE